MSQQKSLVEFDGEKYRNANEIRLLPVLQAEIENNQLLKC